MANHVSMRPAELQDLIEAINQTLEAVELATEDADNSTELSEICDLYETRLHLTAERLNVIKVALMGLKKIDITHNLWDNSDIMRILSDKEN